MIASARMTTWGLSVLLIFVWAWGVLLPCSGTRAEPLHRLTFSAQEVEAGEIVLEDQYQSDFKRHGQLKWQNGALFLNQTQMDESLLSKMGQSLNHLIPVYGIQLCQDGSDDRQGQDVPHYSVDISLKTKSHGVIKLRSISECGHMLPWNVTDGTNLYATYSPETGEALHAILVLLCPDCRFKTQPMPEIDVLQRDDPVTYDQILTGLLNEWKRMDAPRKSGTLILPPFHLMSALEWMNEKRFMNQLKELSRGKGTTKGIQVRAQKLLREMTSARASKVGS